jgi:hypothetical protein
LQRMYVCISDCVMKIVTDDSQDDAWHQVR